MSRTSSTEAKKVVRDGWDAVSYVYRSDERAADRSGPLFEAHRRWLQPVLDGVPPGSKVLDLGCGIGVPDCALLSTRFQVTGVDISDVQVDRARRLVPGATFLRADMTQIAFPRGTFAAVLCLYSLIHVPLAEQGPLLARIHDWLADGGWFVVTTGHEEFEGVEENWLGGGAAMYWSQAAAGAYLGWFEDLGFEVVDQQFVPEDDGGHELFWLRKR